MKRLALDLSLYVYFAAALTIAVGQEIVYYRCRDAPISDHSRFIFSCDAGKTIIVQSAIIGATDIFSLPHQCPITNNTCLEETTIAADLCTWRNSCDIRQNVLSTDELLLSCFLIKDKLGNFININYTCIVPEIAAVGDICHFDGEFYSNSSIYISSFPNFPDAMGEEVNYQCSCQLTSKSSSSSANVTIRALLVKLTGADTCSEKLSIIDSEGDNKHTFCSPCNNAKKSTTVPLASDPVVILFQRGSFVSPFNGKFILEITVSSKSSGNNVMGSMKCGLVGSTMSSSINVSKTSPSYNSTKTTTSSILSQPSGGFSSTNVRNTTSGMTLGSSNMSTDAQQSTLTSSKPASETRYATSSSSIAPSSDNGTPTPASQIASDEKSISTGGIIGIVLGSVGFIVIVIIVVLCLLRKLKQHHSHSKGNATKIQQSGTGIQNMQTTNNIESRETPSSELHTFQSAAHFSYEPQATGYENNWQTKDNSMSNYEEKAPVSDATYGRGMIPPNEQTRLSGDDLTTETQLLNSGDGDTTLVENQLYGENEKPMTDVVASSDYAVVRPVVQYGRTEESAEVDRGHVEMKNNSADHSYYNVPGHTGSGTVQPPAEVSAEAETNSVSDEIQATNPMYKADSDVILIDNTLYGSMLTF